MLVLLVMVLSSVFKETGESVPQPEINSPVEIIGAIVLGLWVLMLAYNLFIKDE